MANLTIWLDKDHYLTVQQRREGAGGALFAIVRLGAPQSGYKPSGLPRGHAMHVVARGRVRLNTLQVTRSELPLPKLRALLAPGGVPVAHRGVEIKIVKKARRR